MLSMNLCSKQWWAKSRELLGEEPKSSNTPALKDEATNIWITDPVGKANLLADTFNEKCVLPDREANAYSQLRPTIAFQHVLATPMVNDAVQILLHLHPSIGTGSDDLPSRILQMCAFELGP